jgi:hypothetical protein
MKGRNVYEANCRQLGVVILQYSVPVGINGKYSAGNKVETSVRILTKGVEVKRRVTQFGGLSDLKNGFRDM